MSAISKINTVLAKEHLTPALALQGYSQIDEQSARIVVAHDYRTYSQDQYRRAIGQLFDGHVTLADDSLNRLPLENHVKVAVTAAVVYTNSQSIMYDDTVAKRFKLVSNNLFVDEADNKLWALSGEGDYRRLVLTTADNMQEILSARLERQKGIQKVTASYSTNVDFATGDYVMFYSPEKYEVQCGFGIVDDKDGLFVFNPVENKCKTVVSAAVIDAAVADSFFCDLPHRDEKIERSYLKTVASIDTEGTNKLLDYFRRLYAHSATYLTEVEKTIRAAHK